jgi:diguanylate cyclase (GGDEF)-like protein
MSLPLESQPPYRPLDRILAGEKRATNTDDLLCLPQDFARAALHTAVQTPINSVTQMVAPDYLPHLQIIAAPENVPELSARWHAQQLGSALGAATDIVALEAASRGTLPPALLGACYDGLLRPVDEQSAKNGGDQLKARAENACVGAVGMVTLYGTNKMFGNLEKGLTEPTWKALAGNKMLTSAISGIPAGLVTTTLSGEKNVHDLAIGTYTSAIAGLGLGAIHAAGERQAVLKQQVEKRETELQDYKKAALTDYLTGLPNRRAADQAMQREFDRSTRSGKPLSLIYGDLDGFKGVNDKLGHAEGDKVLIEVGHRLQNEMRTYDHLSRLGGDEFCIVLPETDHALALKIASRLEQSIKLQVGDGPLTQNVGISLGVVSRQPGESSCKDLEKRADAKMYNMKQARKGQFNL